MKYFIKIRNLLNYVAYLVINLFLPSVQKINLNTLLIIRLDAIGDYLLFRNFLSAIRSSRKYKDYKITLCGNIAWKDLSEAFDKNAVNEFIWLDRKEFYKSISYKFKLLKEIRLRGFETVIHITHSREILYGDTIVSAAQSINTIGSKGSEERHAFWKRKVLTDKIYTRLLDISDEYSFEFEINKYLVGSLLGYSINIKKPEMDISFIKYSSGNKNKFILLVPGAGEKRRMWSGENFRVISEFILKNYSYDIAVSGSAQESYLFDQIAFRNFGQRCFDFFGIKLSGFAKLISEAELLISNDTSAIHFAVAVNIPFICISNGSHFGRFHPYPREVFDKAYYIYPPEIMNNVDNMELLKNKYRFNSNLDINEVNPNTVKEVIKKILG